MRARTLLALLALPALCALAAPARANGIVLLPGGSQSAARGGAVAARPEDPMTLAHDPAGMALLSGHQIMLDLDTAFHDMCVDPYGYYGWGVYQPGSSDFGDDSAVKLDSRGKPIVGATYATTPLPKVCNS